ncbi:MAG: D-2-hydroxyacid dehydrogenase [Clostridia bacterium]|nr:D-2-hydroxyacid dehydrogenase [Clostridia bacterium]
MKITVLDAATLGNDISFEKWEKLGELTVYNTTPAEEVINRLLDSDVAILNKVKITTEVIAALPTLKLICVTATGYDNIDLSACKEKGIAVCNVKGYSTHSVAQVTLTLILALMTHLSEYQGCVKSGDYTKSGIQNRLTPVFHELYGKTFGIIGLGNIGKQVARVAEAFGCKVLCYKRTPDPDFNCVDLETLLRQSDIVTLHLPLSDKTKNIIGEKELGLMKKSAILVNAARGAITDEAAVAKAIKNGIIGGFATDVYSVEPLEKDSPLQKIKNLDNVILTPHMAWGAYESRVRCIEEIAENISSFINGEQRNRVI